MERGKAIQILKKELEKIPDLRRLPPGNEEFKLWHGRVSDVIDAALDSRDKTRFFRAVPLRIDWSWASGETPVQDRAQYDGDLTEYETALKLIIQRYEINGMNTIQSQLPEDTTELANLLFDKTQFHPRVVETSKSLFETRHYAQAIFEAFKAINNFVREKTGQSLDGKDLMAKVFREQDPLIKLNKLKTRSERDEQEGFKFLFMGAMVGIRNPKAHDDIAQMDPFRTLEYLGFASLLMKRIEEGEVTQAQGENG
jgi:uncharacterized protein (TIGR02391 family)